MSRPYDVPTSVSPDLVPGTGLNAFCSLLTLTTPERGDQVVCPFYR